MRWVKIKEDKSNIPVDVRVLFCIKLFPQRKNEEDLKLEPEKYFYVTGEYDGKSEYVDCDTCEYKLEEITHFAEFTHPIEDELAPIMECNIITLLEAWQCVSVIYPEIYFVTNLTEDPYSFRQKKTKLSSFLCDLFGYLLRQHNRLVCSHYQGTDVNSINDCPLHEKIRKNFELQKEDVCKILKIHKL